MNVFNGSAERLTRDVDGKSLTHGSKTYSQRFLCLSVFHFQPGCVNTTEVDIKKSSRMRNPHKTRKVILTLAELILVWVVLFGGHQS